VRASEPKCWIVIFVYRFAFGQNGSGEIRICGIYGCFVNMMFFMYELQCEEQKGKQYETDRPVHVVRN
jgi:hypothetical protein